MPNVLPTIFYLPCQLCSHVSKYRKEKKKKKLNLNLLYFFFDKLHKFFDKLIFLCNT